MNRYFYVPVMDSHIKHDGVSLRDHLRVIDYELFESECKSEDTTKSHSFGVDENLSFGEKDELDMLFMDRMIPRRIVLISSSNGLRELGSEEVFESIPDEYLEPFEIDGEKVVDIFVNNLDYSVHAHHFFELFRKNKDKLHEQKKVSFGKKVMQKLPFLSKKNS